jgi:xanthine dehydrogenase molybdenum-binding subunit
MKEEFSVIGKRLPRLDAPDKVLGRAQFTTDIKLPGMLHGKVLRSPYAHARVLKVDISRAEQLSGVKAVVTREDAPRNPYILFPPGVWLPDQYLFDEKVCYVGDAVAAVAAIREDIAEEALDLIEVEYEELPVVLDPEEAMSPEAPLIHEAERNIAVGPVISKIGDVEKGFQEADYIFEDRYRTSRHCQCQMEPHTAVAYYEPNGMLTVWSSCQTPFPLKEFLSRWLEIPQSKVRVIAPHVGGGFGGKINTAAEGSAVLLSRKAGRPVKVQYSREEVFHSGTTRHPFIVELKTGVKRDGTITARQAKVILHCGPYSNFGPEVLTWARMCYEALYNVPNISFEGYVVYTNSSLTGAYRGFGNPQVTFAMESQMDSIAEKLEIDPIELRKKNHIKVGDIVYQGNWHISSCGLDECLDRAAEQIGWKGKRTAKQPATNNTKRRGIGMACMIHGSGGANLFLEAPDVSACFVKCNPDGTVDLLLGLPDIGQGSTTAMAQIAAEELGVRLEDIRVTTSDTAVTPYDFGSGASRATYITGNAVKTAAAEAKQQILEKAAEMLEASPEDLEARDRRIYVKGSPERGLALAEVLLQCEFAPGATRIIGKAVYTPPQSLPIFAAHFAEVEVDIETGQVKILQMVAAHDCGRAINPMAVEGQIEGAIHHGVGYALSEVLVLDQFGVPQNPSFMDYKILKATEMPRITPIIVEAPDPGGPFGAKGVGEPGMVASAPAITNAIYNAIGIRFKELPITPEKILKALREKGQAK